MVKRFFKYIKKGIENSIIIGIPNFNTNNLYIDYHNISNDFKIVTKEISNEKQTSKFSK